MPLRRAEVGPRIVVGRAPRAPATGERTRPVLDRAGALPVDAEHVEASGDGDRGKLPLRQRDVARGHRDEPGAPDTGERQGNCNGEQKLPHRDPSVETVPQARFAIKARVPLANTILTP